MLIPIDHIRENGNLRRVPPPVGTDVALTESIRVQGVLQPVLVRHDPDRNGYYVLVAGHRRLVCAQAAGLTEIPAEVQEMTDAWAIAAQGAENMVRVPMHAIDQWRAVRDLVAAGMTFPDAAGALGLTDRQARRMDLLGRLDPKLLALIEETDSMPSEMDARIIAAAPRAAQAKAVKAHGKVHDGWQGEEVVRWREIALACKVTRFNRGHAIFDADAMKWDVDLFAQPGAEDEYTTTDDETFLRLQQQALESQVADLQAQKKRVRLAEWDTANRCPRLPGGFVRSFDGDVEKPKKIECTFVAVSPDSGEIKRIVGTDVAARKAAEKKKVEKASAIETAQDDPDEPDDDAPPVPAPEKEKPGLTKAGMDMVLAAKTKALRETLLTGLADIEPERLLALMLLTWGALNVEVRGLLDYDDDGGYDPNRRRFRDLADGVLLPGGTLDQVSLATMRTLCGVLMARVLDFGKAGSAGFYSSTSGDAAEWIGAAIGAENALPRFDSAEFLQQVGGDELRAAAGAIGEKPTGTVKSLRERLVGKMPDWRPTCAAFGAPAPVFKE